MARANSENTAFDIDLASLCVHELVVWIDAARAANDAWNAIYNQPRSEGTKIARSIKAELMRCHRLEDEALEELARRKIPDNEGERDEYAEAIIRWHARERNWTVIAALADEISVKEHDPATPATGDEEVVRQVDIESEVIDVVRSVALASDVLDEALAFNNSEEEVGTTHCRYLLSREEVENVLFTLTVARRAVAELEAKYYGEAHGAVRARPRTEKGEEAALAS